MTFHTELTALSTKTSVSVGLNQIRKETSKDYKKEQPE